MAEQIKKDLKALEDKHSNLTKFMKHCQGIDHTQQKSSKRLLKNKEAEDKFEETLQPIRQHYRTIRDARSRSAAIQALLDGSAAKLEKDVEAVNDPTNTLSHNDKKAAIQILQV